jgi:hypothetical protein
MVTDLTLAILPIFLVWNLSLNRRTKAAVAGILGMGAMSVFPNPPFSMLTSTSASIATIVRVPYLKDLNNTGDFLCTSPL